MVRSHPPRNSEKLIRQSSATYLGASHHDARHYDLLTHLLFRCRSRGTSVTQTLSSEVGPAAIVSAAVAHVYVGTTKGVYLYHAAANGQLTLVSGSPFKLAGTKPEATGNS